MNSEQNQIKSAIDLIKQIGQDMTTKKIMECPRHKDVNDNDDLQVLAWNTFERTGLDVDDFMLMGAIFNCNSNWVYIIRWQFKNRETRKYITVEDRVSKFAKTDFIMSRRA